MTTTETALVSSTELADEELLQKARNARNGAAFALRFDNGYESPRLSNHYESWEQAARALLFNLGWWSNGNTTQMRRLFDRSALGEEFADRDLTEETLSNMIEDVACTLGDDGYDPEFGPSSEGEGEN